MAIARAYRMPTRSEPTRPSKPQPSAGQPRTDGLVGVFATLADQHAQAAALCEQLQAAPHERAPLWPALRRLLVSHEHAEVRELYPQLRQFAPTLELANHHDAEARELDALIDRLDTTAIESDDWGALFEQLVATVLHHAKEVEEAQIFPTAQQVLGEARALELDAKVREAQQKLALAH